MCFPHQIKYNTTLFVIYIFKLFTPIFEEEEESFPLYSQLQGHPQVVTVCTQLIQRPSWPGPPRLTPAPFQRPSQARMDGLEDLGPLPEGWALKWHGVGETRRP